MKLKRKITKAEFEALSEVQQGLYVADNDDYVLDIEDSAFENLKSEKKAIQDKLAKYEAEEEERIRKAEERAKKKALEEYEKAKDDKDIEAIEKSWQEKYDKLNAEKTASDERYSNYVKKALIDTEVMRMANEISTAPALLAPHIRSRLDVDFTGEQPKLIVLDNNGMRSANTVAELQKSFIDNKDFNAIIKITTANGGANSGKFTETPHNSGASGEVKLSNLTDEQLAQRYKASSDSQ